MNNNKILKKSSMKYILFEGQLSESKEMLTKIESRLGSLIDKHDLSDKKMAVHMKKAIYYHQ